MNRIQNTMGVAMGGMLLVVLCCCVEGTSGAAERQGNRPPRPGITITVVPGPELKPGPQGMGTIAGEVRGVDATKHKVVVYAFGDMWYVQPFEASPGTQVSPDGKWKTDTHGGLEYAALLVTNSYKPPATIARLPEVGGEVLAIAKAKPAAPARTITFSGYAWRVKASQNRVGPGPNYFSDSEENVWLDPQGRLHLRITKTDGRWHCAEVVTKESFGYGTYRFYLDSPVDDFDPNVVLGLFTWSDAPEYAHREIDVECSKWGNPDQPTTCQFVVQPYQSRDHLVRFELPPRLDTATHAFTWKNDSIVFQSVKGHSGSLPDRSAILREWTFSGEGLPRPGGENARINLWLMGGRNPTTEKPTEVIIKRFEFVPLRQ